MQKKREILNMEMAGRWSARDLQTFLESIDSLYNFLFTLSVLEQTAKDYERFIRGYAKFPPIFEELFRWWLREPKYRWFFPYPFLTLAVRHPVRDIVKNLDIYVPFEQRLQLYSIEYRSPGSINFIGSGEIIRELGELLERWFTKEGRRMRELEVEDKELDVMEKKIEVLRRVGYSELEIREFMRFPEQKRKAIDGLIKEGKLKILEE